MKASARRLFRLMTYRSRSGQSIVLLSVGFISLISFVGMGTDAAAAFVRLSTLRHAVESAANFAVGHFDQNTTPVQKLAAARQHIQIYGFDPQALTLDSCQTDQTLCQAHSNQAVRVSAQVAVPMRFLSLLGYPSLTLSASAQSSAAVLDVAVLVDSSYSMTYGTLSEEKGSNPNLINFPDFVALGIDGYDNLNPSGNQTAAHPRGSIRSQCANPGSFGQPQGNYSYGGCCNDPTTQVAPPAGTSEQDITDWYVNSGITDPAQNGVINTSHVQSGLGDNLYDDLVCKPYKDVRDATRRFLTTIDFARGDRVMLVTFDAAVKPLTTAGIYTSGGNALPFFTSNHEAIRALNHYAGVVVNPTGSRGGCVAAQRDPYVALEAFYETVAPCPDTNTGGAIQAASSLLSNPSWIRRDAVWVSILLSDGYPNRTPGLDTLGGPSSPALHKIPNNPAASTSGPTSNPNGRFFTVPLPANPSITDPGFCPWWTFCDLSAGTFPDSPAIYPPASHAWNDLFCTSNNPEPLWWGLLNTGTPFHENLTGSRRPFCSDNNPDSRHFCMDTQTGQINPSNSALCSPHYDPDDFARDRVDFAALIDYTSTIKGNFISMFSVFVPSNIAGSNINENILGVKFMRYVADAGDNGIIDNHVQQWYRAHISPDPTPPSYNGADPVYGTLPEDPCAKYDYAELNTLPGNHGAAAPGYPDGTGYEDIYKTNCGNYYYVGSPSALGNTLTDIAARLFTRMGR